MTALYLLLVAVLAAKAVAYTPEALADQITNLPGAQKLTINFNQFSGYLQIPGTNGSLSKNMHYWFVESQNNPAADPLTFWTNGGPGCSGLLGFLTEQGPFKPNADLSLSANPYSWNTVSNMVFIESPCGVGFSYSDNDDDYHNNDQQTALDNYNLIQAFLTRFPEYKSSSLYITSESYGGHYMPTLAQEIVNQNTAASNPILNFKGFAVGNPFTDPYSGTPAMIDTYWGHQLVPKPTYDLFVKQCKNTIKNSKDCSLLEAKILNGVGDLNPYALDYPVCVADEKFKRGYAQRLWLQNFIHQGQGIDNGRRLQATSDYEPCEDDYATNYLNQLTVKNALHVQPNIKWNECSYSLRYNQSDSLNSMAPIYNYLIDGGYGLNILVYSGDDDSVCGTIGTQQWIWNLGYEAVQPTWSTYTVNDQTAGYITQWKNTKLGFVTVHGAGHEVPTYKPEVALDMFIKYLNGTWTNA